MFCRQHGFKLRIVDVGVDYDFSPTNHQHIIDRKIAYGTRNFLHEAAMTNEEYERALKIGAEMVDECHAEGSNVICFGEMGIANTSPSSIWMHLLTGIPLTQCIGAGSGLNTEGMRHKHAVLSQAVENFKISTPKTPQCDVSTNSETQELKNLLSYFGGYEMIAALGGMLRATDHRMVILVDGFIMSACMLAASKLRPETLDFAVFGHCGDEAGHRLMLNAMNATPLLSLGLRLGEGTGAICAYPILQSAVNMINEMDNFDHAEITKYF